MFFINPDAQSLGTNVQSFNLQAMDFSTNANTNNNNNNNNSNTIVFMDSRQDAKESGGRVSVKDVRRSAACLLCRNRKRKCDGQDPCSYCVSKNWTCTYTQQKKRGPQKKNASVEERLQVIATPSTLDCEMMDKLEAQNFGSFYLKYINTMVPMTTSDKMLNPSNATHKVQSYAALAYSARICGDLAKANKYISQARITAGEIYDLADSDSVAALLMMSNYWQLVLNIPQSAHYTRLANSLRRMMPQNALEYRVNMVCEVGTILCDENTSNKKKAKQLRDTAKLILATEQHKEFTPLIASFLTLTSYIIGCLDYNPMFVSNIDTATEFYSMFEKVHLDDQTRMNILEEVNKVSVAVALLGVKDVMSDIHLHTINTIFTPMYLAIAEWRSGHLQEALNFVINVLQGLSSLEKTDSFGFACGVVDFPHVAMTAGLCKFLLDIGQTNLAAQLNDKIKTICKILTPEFDFVLAFANEFTTWIPATDQTPTITLIEEEEEEPTTIPMTSNNNNNTLSIKPPNNNNFNTSTTFSNNTFNNTNNNNTFNDPNNSFNNNFNTNQSVNITNNVQGQNKQNLNSSNAFNFKPTNNLPPNQNTPSPPSNVPSPTYNSPSPPYNNPSPPYNNPSPPHNVPSPNYNIPSPNYTPNPAYNPNYTPDTTYTPIYNHTNQSYNPSPNPSYNSNTNSNPVYNSNTNPNPDYNSQPLYNPNPAYNTQQNPTYSSQNPTYNSNNANPTYNYDASQNPTYSSHQNPTYNSIPPTNNDPFYEQNKFMYQSIDNVVTMLDFTTQSNVNDVNVNTMNNNNITNMHNMHIHNSNNNTSNNNNNNNSDNTITLIETDINTLSENTENTLHESADDLWKLIS